MFHSGFKTRDEQKQTKAHRFSFVAREDVQYGVLPSAALLEHDHPALLLVKLNGEGKKEQLQPLSTFPCFYSDV